MKYGHFMWATNLDPARDSQAIDEVLAQATLAEELGYDSIWFAEHHFTGEVVYADPLVFAAAVAMRTKNIPLGFAVIESGLHHPVRLAVQLALLDNLSKGRLMVGLARGSTYSAFEFRGYGTSAGEAMERTDEFEDLLVKAWTAEDGFQYKGKYWDVAFLKSGLDPTRSHTHRYGGPV